MGTEVPALIALPVQPPDGSVGQHVGTSPPGSALPQRIPKLFMRPVLVHLAHFGAPVVRHLPRTIVLEFARAAIRHTFKL